MRKTISVNNPLRYGGITMYQTDWSFSALQILKNDEGPFNLAMAPLKINGDKKLFGTFLPVGDTNSPNVKGMYVFLLLLFFILYILLRLEFFLEDNIFSWIIPIITQLLVPRYYFVMIMICVS